MKEHKRKNKKAAIVCGIALSAIGFIVIPPIIKKCSGKMMKENGKTEDIDFDDLGPEIVKKEDISEEE